MVAVAPTAHAGSRILSSKCVMLILALLFVIKVDGFKIPPSASKVSIPTKTKSPNNAMIPKAILVDHEQQGEGNPPKIKAQIRENIRTDQIRVPASSNDIERWYLDRLEYYYSYTERNIQCPFFRRRYGDILDNMEDFVRFFLIRPYFSDYSPHLGPRLSCKPMVGRRSKTKNLAVEEILEILHKDWRSVAPKQGFDFPTTPNEKGYYVTGKMSTSIYRDDCEFTSPDPDLPIKGLRKYVGVASHLFDSKTSRSKLLTLQQLGLNDPQESQQTVLKAEWKMSLTLNLPWKPKLPEFTGSTLYYLDEDHLICRHDEAWDISVWKAFLGMLPKKSNGNIHNIKGKQLKCPLAKLSSWFSPHQEHSTPENEQNSKLGPSIESSKTASSTTTEDSCDAGG